MAGRVVNLGGWRVPTVILTHNCFDLVLNSVFFKAAIPLLLLLLHYYRNARTEISPDSYERPLYLVPANTGKWRTRNHGESGVKAPDCGAETGNALHKILYCVIEYVWERTVQHLYFSTLSSYISWKIKKITATIFFAVREDTRLLMLTPTWLKVLQVFCTHAHEKIIPRSIIVAPFVGAFLIYQRCTDWLAPRKFAQLASF